MKRVIVYVEGKSDKLAMQELLRPLIELKAQAGTLINFYETASGDRKVSLLTKMPRRAVNTLNDPAAIVVIVPDLYPKNKAFRHETFAEMKSGIVQNFEKELEVKGVQDARLRERFHVFCFKYELEALVLASKEALLVRLDTETLSVTWSAPVEDINHDSPPQTVVEMLFHNAGQRYVKTVDAPLILGLMEYRVVAERCPQCFKPFVEFLEAL